jgi:hypothetical protein
MNVLPVTSVKAVLTVMIPKVSSSNPDTGRLVAHRQPIAPTIQARATMTAVATLKITSITHKRAAGANTAVARLTATRATTSRRCGRAGR